MKLGNTAHRVLRVHTIAKLYRCSDRTVRRRIPRRPHLAERIGRRPWGVRASNLRQLMDVTGGGYV
jgi:hypothetical protein